MTLIIEASKYSINNEDQVELTIICSLKAGLGNAAKVADNDITLEVINTKSITDEWKLQDFSVSQILREINFGNFRSGKTKNSLSMKKSFVKSTIL